MDFFIAFKETPRFLVLFLAICLAGGTAGGLLLVRLELKVMRIDPGVFRVFRTAGLLMLVAVISLIFLDSIIHLKVINPAVSGWIFMICTFLLSHCAIALYAVGCFGLDDSSKVKGSNFIPFIVFGYLVLFSAMMLLDANFWFAPPVRYYVKSVCLILLIPVAAVLIRAAALRIAARNPGDLDRATRVFSLLFALMLLGDAANHLHDFVWCGYSTGWYSEGIGNNPGSYDMAPFAGLVRLAGGSYQVGKDYAVFGAYATLLMPLEILGAAALLRVGALWNREEKIWPVSMLWR